MAQQRGTPQIALDATLWDEPTTGIGLYTRKLHRALSDRGLSVLRVGARTSGEAPRTLASRTAYTLAELPGWLEAHAPAVYHAVGNFNLPLRRVRGVRTVLTVHDLIPLLLPDSVSRAHRLQFGAWLHRSLQLADHVVCVSERTRQDLLAHAPTLDPARVSAVYNGVDHVHTVPPPDRIGAQYLETLALPERFLLYAGSLDRRKNVGLVLEALERLFAEGVQVTLVLVGQAWFGSGPVEKKVAHLRAQGLDLRPLGYLEAPLLYALMRRAWAFVFPSLYEGFGLPPLEAMSLGVPAIVSDRGALPEVCGAAARQVPAGDAGALAAELRWMLGLSVDARERWAEAGRAKAARFTWAAAAERMETLYRDL